MSHAEAECLDQSPQMRQGMVKVLPGSSQSSLHNEDKTNLLCSSIEEEDDEEAVSMLSTDGSLHGLFPTYILVHVKYELRFSKSLRVDWTDDEGQQRRQLGEDMDQPRSG